MSDTTDLRELDIQIAKALGYELNEVEMYGSIQLRQEGHGKSYELRPYSSDLNTAASLRLPDDMHLEIRVYLDGVTHVSIIHNTFMGTASPDAVATTEAEARARAWLAWHEATQKTNAGSLLSESGSEG